MSITLLLLNFMYINFLLIFFSSTNRVGFCCLFLGNSVSSSIGDLGWSQWRIVLDVQIAKNLQALGITGPFQSSLRQKRFLIRYLYVFDQIVSLGTHCGETIILVGIIQLRSSEWPVRFALLLKHAHTLIKQKGKSNEGKLFSRTAVRK